MAYQRKYLGGWLPFWPSMPMGFYLGVLVGEVVAVFTIGSGSRYLRQHWPRSRWRVLPQLPGALLSALTDEARNVLRSRLNNRLV